MRKFLITLAAAAGLAAPAAPALAAGGEIHIPSQNWSFEGPFGTFDRAQLQRGFQVYVEVCKNCHGLELTNYRNLAQLGFSEDAIKALASTVIVQDVDLAGGPIERPGIPADPIPSPYDNPRDAAEANGGVAPPDLTLMADARPNGANYIYAFLTGFQDPPPPGVEASPGKYYNDAFPGHWVSMPPQLIPDIIEYADGTPATEAQMAKDVTAFLAWAAEPNMEQRKELGIKVVLFLVVLAGLLYASYRHLWRNVEH